MNFQKTYLSFFGKSENHILKIGCDDLKCTIALMIQKKKKIILDRSNTKLLLIIIIIFVLKHFFVIYYLKCAHFFDSVRCKHTKFLIDTQIDLTKLCSNEINTKTCVQNICCCFLIRFRITLV